MLFTRFTITTPAALALKSSIGNNSSSFSFKSPVLVVAYLVLLWFFFFFFFHWKIFMLLIDRPPSDRSISQWLNLRWLNFIHSFPCLSLNLNLIEYSLLYSWGFANCDGGFGFLTIDWSEIVLNVGWMDASLPLICNQRLFLHLTCRQKPQNVLTKQTNKQTSKQVLYMHISMRNQTN